VSRALPGTAAPAPPETSAPPARPVVDPEALLAALVLDPTTYSRNRFFDLYQHPRVHRIRRRASQIRSIVRQVTGADPAQAGERLRFSPADGGRVELTYEVPALGLRRTALLDPLELSLVRLAIARSGPAAPPPGDADPDRARVEAALARLAPPPADAREAPL
jgi:hypothetical protein